MSELISKQAVKDIILGGVSTDTDADKEYVCGLIDNLPSVDIMECARAVKEYCNNTRCKDCDFDTSGWLCRVAQTTPGCWDLPEGETE